MMGNAMNFYAAFTLRRRARSDFGAKRIRIRCLRTHQREFAGGAGHDQ
jgi:hypothetical protein